MLPMPCTEKIRQSQSRKSLMFLKKLESDPPSLCNAELRRARGGDIDVSTKCAISDTSPARVMESKWLRSLDRPSDDVVVWWQSKCSLVWWSSVAGNLDFSHCCFSCPCPLALEKRRQSQIKN